MLDTITWRPIALWDTEDQKRAQRSQFPMALVTDGSAVILAAVADGWIDLVNWGLNGHEQLDFNPVSFQLLPAA